MVPHVFHSGLGLRHVPGLVLTPDETKEAFKKCASAQKANHSKSSTLKSASLKSSPTPHSTRKSLPPCPLPPKPSPSKPLPPKSLPSKPLPPKPLPPKPLPPKTLPSKPLSPKPIPSKSLPTKRLFAKPPLKESPPAKSFPAKKQAREPRKVKQLQESLSMDYSSISSSFTPYWLPRPAQKSRPSAPAKDKDHEDCILRGGVIEYCSVPISNSKLFIRSAVHLTAGMHSCPSQPAQSG